MAWEREAAPLVTDPRSGTVHAVLSDRGISDKARVCLVTPFDEAVVECVRSGRPVSRCFLALERRLEQREAATW